MKLRTNWLPYKLQKYNLRLSTIQSGQFQASRLCPPIRQQIIWGPEWKTIQQCNIPFTIMLICKPSRRSNNRKDLFLDLADNLNKKLHWKPVRIKLHRLQRIQFNQSNWVAEKKVVTPCSRTLLVTLYSLLRPWRVTLSWEETLTINLPVYIALLITRCF